MKKVFHIFQNGVTNSHHHSQEVFTSEKIRYMSFFARFKIGSKKFIYVNVRIAFENFQNLTNSFLSSS